MAQAFLTAERILAQGLGLLARQLVLPQLVTRLGQADFVGAKDDTVTIRVPSLLRGREYEWRTRTNPIVIDELVEHAVPVVLDKHVYSAVQITDEELTLDIASWGNQVANPQMRAVAEQLESYIADAMADANFRHSVAYTPPANPTADDTSFFDAAVAARKWLNIENVPANGRVILLGANVEEHALRSPHLIKANEAGTDSALRDAVIGRIAGFTVIGNVNSVDPDFAIAFHPTAFAFANFAPAVPAGASAGASDAYQGLAMRWIRDYEATYLRDRSVFSAFAGAASVEDGRNTWGATGSGYGNLTSENVRAVEIDYTAP